VQVWLFGWYRQVGFNAPRKDLTLCNRHEPDLRNG
jgi:hypothetical protein